MKAYKLVKRRKEIGGERLCSYTQLYSMGGIKYVPGREALPKPGNGALACFGSAPEALDFAVKDRYLGNTPTEEAHVALAALGIELWECEVVPAVQPGLWEWDGSVKRVCYWEPVNTIYAASLTLTKKVWPIIDAEEEALNGRD